jgi:hypothetical protein
MERLWRGLLRVQDGILATATTARCWWRCRRGHTDALVLTPGRIFLQCAACGRQTPGWFVCLARDRGVTLRGLS